MIEIVTAAAPSLCDRGHLATTGQIALAVDSRWAYVPVLGPRVHLR